MNGGADTYQLRALGDSLLANFDKITDFAIGTDTMDGPNQVTAANVANLGSVAALTEAGIQAVLTGGAFAANGAATFTFVDGGTTRTFVAINDGTGGYLAVDDAIIEITGYTGTLTDLAIA